MKIGEEIQASKFADEYHKMTVNVVFTGHWLTGFLEQRASQENITLHQFNVLRILRGQHPDACTNAMIKERMLERKSDVSRIVDRLVSKGLVHRCKSDCDGRAVALTITDQGMQALENLEEPMMLRDIYPETSAKKNACNSMRYWIN